MYTNSRSPFQSVQNGVVILLESCFIHEDVVVRKEKLRYAVRPLVRCVVLFSFPDPYKC